VTRLTNQRFQPILVKYVFHSIEGVNFCKSATVIGLYDFLLSLLSTRSNLGFDIAISSAKSVSACILASAGFRQEILTFNSDEARIFLFFFESASSET
jgi:uncharacterized protein (UPF0262 family)